MEIEVLDWREPVLPEAGRRLVEAVRDGQRVPLGDTVVVVPGAAAARRLLQHLVLMCDEERLRLTPPMVTTVGRLPELLYPSRRPFADETMQLLAWVDALRSLDRESLNRLMAAPPTQEQFDEWLELSATISNVHRELAGEARRMGDVIEALQDDGLPHELRRWEVLEQVQRRYLERLDEFGHWDKQTARRYAIEHQECRTERRIVMLAAVDLPLTVREMLDQVADQVTIYQVASAEDLLGFDSHGCLDELFWSERRVDLSDVELHVVEGPEDQAGAAIEFLAEHAAELGREQLTIGLPDEELLPFLERSGERVGVSFDAAAGKPMSRSPLYRWMTTLADWISSRSFRALASLVRHPAVFARLSQQLGDDRWLGRLDAWREERLPALLESDPALIEDPHVARLIRMIDGWSTLLIDDAKRPAGEWGSRWLETMERWLGDVSLDRDDPADRESLEMLSALRDQWSSLAQVPQALQPLVDAVTAQRWVLRTIGSGRVRVGSDPDSVSVTGWLDLPWDDASHTVVLGFNEGRVPTPEPIDPLLPNSLRQVLGIMHTARRYARDAYYLSVLVAGRKSLRLVAGRRDAAGDPLVPGRLWFAAPREVVAARAVETFDRPPLVYREAMGDGEGEKVRSGEGKAGLRIEVPDASWIPERLSPTDFRAYLKCPYRFHLERVQGLRAVSDDAGELSPGAFGDLLHRVLAEFYHRGEWESDDPKMIADRLHRILTELVGKRLAPRHLPAVDLQVEQMRVRLAAFAECQAKWYREGWRIEKVEWETPERALETQAGQIKVKGRIDRIDRHSESGKFMLLDYKSSESNKGPDAAHRGKGKWVDLQLPLYHWLFQESAFVRSAAGAPQVQVGFVVLGASTEDIAFHPASWNKAELDEAINEAERIASKIMEGVFWPPAKISKDLRQYDAFDALMSLESAVDWDEQESSNSDDS